MGRRWCPPPDVEAAGPSKTRRQCVRAQQGQIVWRAGLEAIARGGLDWNKAPPPLEQGLCTHHPPQLSCEAAAHLRTRGLRLAPRAEIRLVIASASGLFLISACTKRHVCPHDRSHDLLDQDTPLLLRGLLSDREHCCGLL
jgi:hypothetical protein